MLFQALDDFLVERGKLAYLLFEDLLDVIFAELTQILETDECFVIEIRYLLFDKLQQRRPN
jgi:hypothetical protein